MKNERMIVMAIAETGDLQEIIKIVRSGADTVDEYGDPVNSDEIIYPRLYALQRTQMAKDVEKTLSDLSVTTEFVIRHRYPSEPKITSDMEVVHEHDGQEDRYKIDKLNSDTQYKEWDVIICHANP